MKLPHTVLSAMRGLGGASLIAAAVAGCGGTYETRSTQPQLIVAEERPIDRANDNRNDEPPADETQPPVDYDYDVAVACGRG